MLVFVVKPSEWRCCVHFLPYWCCHDNSFRPTVSFMTSPLRCLKPKLH